MVLQLPRRRADGFKMQMHVRLFGRPPALLEVAGRAGSGDIFPRRATALRAGNDVVERKILADAAILALKTVTEK